MDQEAREQFLHIGDSLPEHVIACLAGGSNATGVYSRLLG